jgi:hypothetical protein
MAGLFGFLYTAFTLGTKAVMSIKENIENENYRQDAIQKNEYTYIDSKGNACSTKNGRKVMYANEYLHGYNNLPDKVLKYVDTDEIIRNFSQEDRNKTETYYYNEAKKLNRTAYRIGGKYDKYCNVGDGKPKGYRYKDMSTNAIYVIRQFNNMRFYMDINTGLLVRKTDGQLKLDEERKNQNGHLSDFLKDIKENTMNRVNKDLLLFQERNNLIDYKNNQCFLDGRDLYEETEE